jgi:hypothetical protein
MKDQRCNKAKEEKRKRKCENISTKVFRSLDPNERKPYVHMFLA